MGGAACLFERGDLIVKFLPSAAKDVRACDHNVNILCPRFDRAADFRYALGQGRKSCGESGGDSGNSHTAAFKRPSGCFHEPVIDANRCNLEVEIFDTQAFHEFVQNRSPGLRAQASDALVCVVSRKGGKVHARDGPQQPCCLPIFFHRATRHMTLLPAFHGAGIHSNLLHPVQIEWYALIG